MPVKRFLQLYIRPSYDEKSSVLFLRHIVYIMHLIMYENKHDEPHSRFARLRLAWSHGGGIKAATVACLERSQHWSGRPSRVALHGTARCPQTDLVRIV